MLRIPQNVTVWLDLEGVPVTTMPPELAAKINAWAHAVQGAGFVAGLYVGAGCSLTSEELYALAVTRYWKGASRIVDRNGELAEPKCGWCMVQLQPCNTNRNGVLVDLDVAQEDYFGRSAFFASSLT